MTGFTIPNEEIGWAQATLVELILTTVLTGEILIACEVLHSHSLKAASFGGTLAACAFAG